MAVSGPAVAVSATNQQLAIGPPGPQGAQGPTGPQGPIGPTGPAGTGTTPAAPTIWTATVGPSGGPAYAYPTGVNQSTRFDTTAGAITATLDPTPSNGEQAYAKDVGLALASHALTVSSGGVKIEYPPGTIGTANLVFGAGSLGVALNWEWEAAYSTWFFIG